MLTRKQIRQYFKDYPEFFLFMVWLEEELDHPILIYDGLAARVRAIIDEPLALLTDGLEADEGIEKISH